MAGISSRATWWWIAGIVGVAAVAGEIMLPSVRGGTGRSLWLGIAAASLLLVCGLIGPRKRLLRLRMGPIRWWNASHNALGVLTLLLGLLHCGFQWGGILTSVLLGGLVVVAGCFNPTNNVTVTGSDGSSDSGDGDESGDGDTTSTGGELGSETGEIGSTGSAGFT